MIVAFGTSTPTRSRSPTSIGSRPELLHHRAPGLSFRAAARRGSPSAGPTQPLSLLLGARAASRSRSTTDDALADQHRANSQARTPDDRSAPTRRYDRPRGSLAASRSPRQGQRQRASAGSALRSCVTRAGCALQRGPCAARHRSDAARRRPRRDGEPHAALDQYGADGDLSDAVRDPRGLFSSPRSLPEQDAADAELRAERLERHRNAARRGLRRRQRPWRPVRRRGEGHRARRCLARAIALKQPLHRRRASQVGVDLGDHPGARQLKGRRRGTARSALRPASAGAVRIRVPGALRRAAARQARRAPGAGAPLPPVAARQEVECCEGVAPRS